MSPISAIPHTNTTLNQVIITVKKVMFFKQNGLNYVKWHKRHIL